jgi:hypothetical protein
MTQQLTFLAPDWLKNKEGTVPVFSMVDSALDPESRQIARLSLQTFELAPPSSHPQSSVVAPAPKGSNGGNPLTCEGGGGGSQSNSDEGTDTLVVWYSRCIIIPLYVDR